MNIWNQMPYERLRSWQAFRNSINEKSFEQALRATQHLWSYAPYVAHYLTTDQINIWPDPWELLYENYYCDLAKALGIVYTLYLSAHRPEMEIQIYQDQNSKETYNLVFIEQGKYVLNMVHDEVVNKEHITSNLKLVETVPIRELKLDQIE